MDAGRGLHCIGGGETVLVHLMPRRSLLNYIGIAILIFGLACGEFIYWRSLGRPAADDDNVESVENARVYEQTIERTTGVFGLIIVEWDQALGKLMEPGPLAITLAVASILAAGGCFFAASRLPRE
jgi:hypothetical protein